MEMLKIRIRELVDTFYKDDERLDCEYYVYDEGDNIMIPKLKKLETICGNYDSYEEVEDYIYTNFKMVNNIKVHNFYV